MEVIHNLHVPVAPATFPRLHGGMTTELHTPSSPGSGPLRLLALLSASDGRELWRSRDSSGHELLTIRSRSLGALLRVRRERALIEDLHRDGISAAPRIVRTSFTGYSLEAVHELSLGAGKRRHSTAITESSVADPGREAVRLDLLDLLSELHGRSLSLNLAGVRGVGFRADGSVAVVDFSRIGEASFSRVRADNRWVESLVSGVVQAPATLTRRIHLHEEEHGEGTEKTSGHRERGRHAKPHRVEQAAGRTGAQGLLRRYRTALLTTGGVVTASAVLALGITFAPHLPALAPDRPAQGVAGPAAAPGSARAAGTPAPATKEETSAATAESLEDPYALLTHLAKTRLEYLSGARSDNPAVVPGSPAAARDSDLRSRVNGARVEGGRTVVHEAQVLTRAPTRATIRAVVSDDAATVGEGEETQELPASSPRAIIMTLERDPQTGTAGRGQWRIRDVTRAQ